MTDLMQLVIRKSYFWPKKKPYHTFFLPEICFYYKHRTKSSMKIDILRYSWVCVVSSVLYNVFFLCFWVMILHKIYDIILFSCTKYKHYLLRRWDFPKLDQKAKRGQVLFKGWCSRLKAGILDAAIFLRANKCIKPDKKLF